MPRAIHITITTISERVVGECTDCGFDALLRLRGYHLTSTGVQCLFDQTYCGRCRAEARQGRMP